MGNDRDPASPGFGKTSPGPAPALVSGGELPPGYVVGEYRIANVLGRGGIGAHVLRHTHAGLQIEGGASAKVVGDILGHRDPSSTSAYVRVALGRLRALSLPVPR